MAFSPDSQSIASASRDGSIRVWDVEHGDTACGVKATYIANTEFEYTVRTGQPRSGSRYASLPWQTGMPIAIQMKLSGCVRTCEAGIMSP